MVSVSEVVTVWPPETPVIVSGYCPGAVEAPALIAMLEL